MLDKWSPFLNSSMACLSESSYALAEIKAYSSAFKNVSFVSVCKDYNRAASPCFRWAHKGEGA